MKTICIPFLAAFTACSVPTSSSLPGDQPSRSEQQEQPASKLYAHGQPATNNDRPTEPFTKYLGELRFSSGARYRVVAQFRTVQAAIEKHGHSSVTIRDTVGKIVRTYQLDFPEQLPTGVINNKLVFHFGNKRYLLPLEEKLPVLLCIPLDQGCY